MPKELLTLDEARNLLDPPLTLFELIQATFWEEHGLRELPKYYVPTGERQTRTYVRQDDLVKFATKHGLKVLDKP